MPKITIRRGESIIEVEISDTAVTQAAVDILCADKALKLVDGDEKDPKVIDDKKKLANALVGRADGD